MRATLEQWRMFKAVLDYGGFNQAAQQVHKSQSSIHHAVQKLEDSLGVALLVVHGRKTVATPAGELLLRRATYLLDEAAKLEDVAGTLGAGVETSLHVAVDEAFPQTTLYQVLEQVSDEFPLLRIELKETILNGANELLEHGGAVIGISPLPFRNGLNEEICQETFIPVAAPAHPLHCAGQPLTFENLKSHRQIVVRDSAADANSDSGWLGAEQRWTVSHLHSSINLVCQGLGFAWLPEQEIRQHLSTGSLKRLPLQIPQDRSLKFYLNYRDADSLGPAARSFMGHLRLQSMQLTQVDQLPQ
jgi:DNA-binding transcriptional LysR family regulator